MWILFLRSNCWLCGKDLNLKKGLLYYIEFHIVDKINVVQNWAWGKYQKAKKRCNLKILIHLSYNFFTIWYLLSTYCMPGSVLGIEDITEHRIDKNPCPAELTFFLFFCICGILKKDSFFLIGLFLKRWICIFWLLFKICNFAINTLIAATYGRPCRLLKCCISFFLENLTTIIIQSGFSHWPGGHSTWL